MSSDSVSNLMKGHMESLAAEGKRADGRGRPLRVRLTAVAFQWRRPIHHSPITIVVAMMERERADGGGRGDR